MRLMRNQTYVPEVGMRVRRIKHSPWHRSRYLGEYEVRRTKLTMGGLWTFSLQGHDQYLYDSREFEPIIKEIYVPLPDELFIL